MDCKFQSQGKKLKMREKKKVCVVFFFKGEIQKGKSQGKKLKIKISSSPREIYKKTIK